MRRFLRTCLLGIALASSALPIASGNPATYAGSHELRKAMWA